MSWEFFDSVVAAGNAGPPQLTVQRIPERSSWVSLPPALVSQLYRGSQPAPPLALELRPVVQRAGVALPGGPPKYVAWGGACGVPGVLGVPTGLLGGLGLAEGGVVVLQPLWDLPPAASVTVEPASEDDWEVVELNAEYLEAQLLSQVGVVSPSQPFPFWVHTHLVSLKVVALEPPGTPAARLVPGSEIHIAPRVRVRSSAATSSGQPLFGSGQGRGGEAGAAQQGSAAAGALQPGLEQPLVTALRVHGVGTSSVAARHAAQQAPQGLPPSVQPVAVSPVTLARCRLREGDWVRLVGSGAGAGAAGGRFACLVPCAEVAVGHLALTAAQSAAFGVEPFAHVKVLRLDRQQRSLVIEAAELLQRQQQAKAGAGAAAAGVTARAAEGGGEGAGSASAVWGQDAEPAMTEQALEEPEGPAVEEEEGVLEDEVEGASWLGEALETALQVLLPVVAAQPRTLLQSWGVPRLGGLLVTGPPGSGKSALLSAAAAALQRHPQCLAYTVTVCGREITSEGTSHVRALISEKVQEALDHMPSLLIFDDLDVLCHAEADGPEGASAPSGDPGLIAWLCDVLDYLCTPAPEWGMLPAFMLPQLTVGGSEGEKAGVNGVHSCSAVGEGGSGQSSRQGDGTEFGNASGSGGSSNRPPNGSLSAGVGAAQQGQFGTYPGGPPAGLLWPPVAFAATCKEPAALAAPLRAAGRLDHIVTLPPPSAKSRAAILAAGVRARGAAAAPTSLQAVAERAEGFDAADLEVLLDRVMHLALLRRLATPLPSPLPALAASGEGGERGRQLTAVKGRPGVELEEGDLLRALEGMTPAAFWGVHTQTSVQQGVSGWEDVGGMEDVRAALYESLELPTKYAKLVAQAPLRLRTGVLLYGPPGCGKTHVVSAAVAAAKVRCVTVSGPELLNKYIGASEAAVRDVFRRAAAAAPSVLFFDEFDAIAPQRGHDNTGVTDRVVNQLLTELDGVEGLKGVCVIAATSRPDLIDAALLRPGRLDRLLYCGFPSPQERARILEALARLLRLAPDVDLEEIAQQAEFFSGADLSAVLSEAQLAAVHEILDSAPPSAAAGPLHKHRHRGGEGPPVIARRHLIAALAAARPSVPEAERDRLGEIYRKFWQCREPGGTVDKGKGKRVSWA